MKKKKMRSETLTLYFKSWWSPGAQCQPSGSYSITGSGSDWSVNNLIDLKWLYWWKMLASQKAPCGIDIQNPILIENLQHYLWDEALTSFPPELEHHREDELLWGNQLSRRLIWERFAHNQNIPRFWRTCIYSEKECLLGAQCAEDFC